MFEKLIFDFYVLLERKKCAVQSGSFTAQSVCIRDRILNPKRSGLNISRPPQGLRGKWGGRQVKVNRKKTAFWPARTVLFPTHGLDLLSLWGSLLIAPTLTGPRKTNVWEKWRGSCFHTSMGLHDPPRAAKMICARGQKTRGSFKRWIVKIFGRFWC